MRRKIAFFGVVGVSLALFPSLGQAQRGAGGMARSFASAPAAMHSGGVAIGHVGHAATPRAVAPGGVRVASRPGTITRMRMSNGVIHITRRPSNPVRRSQVNSQDFVDDTNAVPGLGFDFVHFAAVHPNAFRGRHRTDLGGFFPFFSGGFLMPSVPAVVEDDTEGADETAAVEDSPRRRVRIIAPDTAPAYAASPQPAYPSTDEEYVFVRRDGTVFFAVAYSWENGALRYITSQGTRGTVTREALDLNATQQFNDQRGLNFRAPA